MLLNLMENSPEMAAIMIDVGRYYLEKKHPDFMDKAKLADAIVKNFESEAKKNKA